MVDFMVQLDVHIYSVDIVEYTIGLSKIFIQCIK